MAPSNLYQTSSSSYYPPTDYNKAATTTHYMTSGNVYSTGHGTPPYPRTTLQNRRQSMATATHQRNAMNPLPTSDPRSRQDLHAHNMPAALTDDLATAVSTIEISQQPVGAWDQTPPMQEPHATHLPPISEALHRIFPNTPAHPSPSSDGSSSLQTQPLTQHHQVPSVPVPVSVPIQMPVHVPAAASVTSASAPVQQHLAVVDNTTILATTGAAPPAFYTQVPYDMVGHYPGQEMQAPNMIPRHPSPGHTMMTQNSNLAAYGRRVTHPFVPSIDTSSGLMMTNLASSETSGSSPLIGSPFPHGGLVGVNSAPVTGMSRSSPLIGYGMDTMGMQQQQQQQQHVGQHPSPLQGQASAYQHTLSQTAPHPITHCHPEQPSTAAGQTVGWLPENGDMQGTDAQNNSKLYSFIPLSGVNTKKRPRRRFDEIERLYVCNWGECEKSYGTLNHLNAHVSMQKHGPKRDPIEFKELRKAWRRHKRAEEEAAKQAAAFHQQQNQHPLQICEPMLNNMHAHPMAVHPMSHHQPHQLPHPHAHPNQHMPQHRQSHTQALQHHPLGF
ncbi:hypothetical protein BGZ94_010150 [Podila epigama]|nr:hypothetical protein BGZ94_010150 [Podila epigama]